MIEVSAFHAEVKDKSSLNSTNNNSEAVSDFFLYLQENGSTISKSFIRSIALRCLY